MTTSQDKPFLSTVLDRERPPAFVLGYLRNSLMRRLHLAVLGVFVTLERRGEITKAELARRLSKDPSQITKWLGGGPHNFEIETVSDLLAGMGYEAEILVKPIKESSARATLPWAHLASLEEDAANDPQIGQPSADLFRPPHSGETETRPAEQAKGAWTPARERGLLFA